MYKLHLILKYLRRRKIAWISLLAVMLCTTMVIVVISVMGGWLTMYENSARGMTGDVVVKSPGLSGFAYYQEMIDRIERLPNVEAAVTQIETMGLISLGNSDVAQKTDPARVFGIHIEQMGRVNAWPKSLYQQYSKYVDQGETPPARETFDLRDQNSVIISSLPEDLRFRQPPQAGVEVAVAPKNGSSRAWDAFLGWLHGGEDAYPMAAAYIPPPPVWNRVTLIASRPGFDSSGLLIVRGKLSDADRDALLTVSRGKIWRDAIQRLFHESNYPGMIVGARLIDIHKDIHGDLVGRDPWKYKQVWGKLTVLGIGEREQIDPTKRAERTYWVVDDSRTGMWQYDSNSVYVDFDTLQRDLGMEAKEVTLSDTGEKIVEPARTTEINIRVKPGANVEQVKTDVEKVIDGVIDAHVRDPGWLSDLTARKPRVETWHQASQKYLDAIENEKVMMVFLFGIISLVAVFLIFCIFYMIVAEKTKDIGIIKSVGATNTGVAAIFLGYGLAIGIVGAGLGLLISYLLIHNINEIHTWLGKTFRLVVWNPEVYAFDTIPNVMQPWTVTVICTVAVLASVIGALVPAIRAARMHPIEALRWE